MTLGRTTAGINKVEEAGTAHGQIRSADALRQMFPTTVPTVSNSVVGIPEMLGASACRYLFSTTSVWGSRAAC